MDVLLALAAAQFPTPAGEARPYPYAGLDCRPLLRRLALAAAAIAFCYVAAQLGASR